MSYSNPTWYGVGNVGAFSKSFEKTFNTQFKSANDYYEAKAKEIEEYNNNLENQAEEQRKELLKGKEITPQILADVESQVQKFLKEGRTFKEGQGFFGAPEVQKKTKAEMDKAASSFTGRIGVMNELLDNALSGKLQPKRDLNRGSATFLKYTKVINAIKEDASNVKFDYKGNNEYDFTVTYKDENGKSITVDSDELKSIIELNDPETRKLIDKNFKDTSVQMYGLTKTAFSERIAKGEYKKDPRTGSIYVPEEDVDVIVGEQVGKMKKETINDYFNNEIEYDDAKRLEILSKDNPSGLELKDIADKGNNEQKEALSTLLDIPEGDVASREAAFNKLGITDKAKKQEYIDALNQYRKDIVADRFKEELKSQGLQTKYFTGKRQQRQPSPSSSGSDEAFNRYAEEKGLETTNTVNTAIRFISEDKRGTKNSRLTNVGASIDDFEIDKVKVGGSVKEVRNVEVNKYGKIKLVYSKGMLKGQPVEDSVTYDVYNPSSMRDFYSATSVQAPSGTKAMRLYADLYDREMTNNYTTAEGLAALDNELMVNWFDFVYKKGTDLQKQTILNHKFSDPTIRDIQDDFKIDYKKARTSN